jgi:signal transduction histidine kinase
VIEAVGEPAKGATFTIRLPLPLPEDVKEVSA